MFKHLFLIVFATSSICSAISAYGVAKKTYNLDDGEDTKAKMLMKITQSNGSERERDLTFFRKDFGKDNRTLLKFNSPALVKGTSFLTWNNRNKDNDQWIFLPALKRVRRIATAKKSDSFMGSSFSFEDLSKRSLKKDRYELLEEDTYNGKPCFVLEAKSKSTNEKIRKRIYWIRKDNFVIVKSKQFDKQNRLLKTLTTKGVKKIQGKWIVTYSLMKNHKKKSKTYLKLSEIEFDTGIGERMFRKESLK
jgi:hypothetical protein